MQEGRTTTRSRAKAITLAPKPTLLSAERARLVQSPDSAKRSPAATLNSDVAWAFVVRHSAPCRLTVAELIAGTGLKRATLYRALAIYGGVHTFLMSVRLEAARSLLASGLPCKEVAKRCGFKSQAHFSRRFLADYGFHASDYQKRSRAELQDNAG